MAWLKLRGSAEEAQREQFYAMRRNILLADDLDQFTRETILAVMDSAWSRHLMDLDMISEYATRRGSIAVSQDQAARSYEILLDQINEYLSSYLANGDIRAP